MAWINIQKAPLNKSQRRETPDNFWHKCTNCHEIISTSDFRAHQNVCTKCQHHFSITPEDRLLHFLDKNTFEAKDSNLVSPDPLQFNAKKKIYNANVKQSPTYSTK